jgi:hypothetical protein
MKEKLMAVPVRQRVTNRLERREDGEDCVRFKILPATAVSKNSDRRPRKSETVRHPKHMTWADAKPKKDHG